MDFPIDVCIGPFQGQYSSSHVFAQAVGRWKSIDDKGMDGRWSVGNAEGWRGLLLNAPLSRDFVEECGIWGARRPDLETKPVGEL